MNKLTKRQQEIVNFLKKHKRMPLTYRSKKEMRLQNSISHYLNNTKNNLDFVQKIKQMMTFLPESRDYKYYLNDLLLLNFVFHEKRKPSRYSKNAEERRLWSIMIGRTTRSNNIYDAEFTKEFNKMLKDMDFKFKKSPNYWTLDKVILHSKGYSSYGDIRKNRSLYAAMNKFSIKKKNFNKIKGRMFLNLKSRKRASL
jgi:hypothetical protein